MKKLLIDFIGDSFTTIQMFEERDGKSLPVKCM